MASSRERYQWLSLPFRFVACPVLVLGTGVLLFSIPACSEPQPKLGVVQAQPKRPLTIPVKPISRQQSAAANTFPAQTEIRRDPRLGTITFLKAPNLSERLEHNTNFAQLQASNQFGDIARAFIEAYRAEFRLTHPANELQVKSVKTDDLGLTHVRLQQTFHDVPVWAAELRVHLNADTQVYLVQGRYIPTPHNLSTEPSLTDQAALQRTTNHLGKPLAGCLRCQATLVIFASEDTTPRLAYRVLALLSLVEGWEVMIDAQTGEVLQKLSAIQRVQ